MTSLQSAPKIPVYFDLLKRFEFFWNRNILEHGMKQNLSENSNSINSFILLDDLKKQSIKQTNTM